MRFNSDHQFAERLWHDLTDEERIAREEDFARDQEAAERALELAGEDGCRCERTDDDRMDNRRCAVHSAARRAELRASWAQTNPYAYGPRAEEQMEMFDAFQIRGAA